MAIIRITWNMWEGRTKPGDQIEIMMCTCLLHLSDIHLQLRSDTTLLWSSRHRLEPLLWYRNNRIPCMMPHFWGTCVQSNYATGISPLIISPAPQGGTQMGWKGIFKAQLTWSESAAIIAAFLPTAIPCLWRGLADICPRWTSCASVHTLLPVAAV